MLLSKARELLCSQSSPHPVKAPASSDMTEVTTVRMLVYSGVMKKENGNYYMTRLYRGFECKVIGII